MKIALLFTSMLVLIGCSGGGGSHLNPSPSPSPTPSPSGLVYGYVLNAGDNSISQFKMGTNGDLTEIASTVPTEDFPRSMTLDKVHNTIYTANLASGSISQFKISADGSLQILDAPVSAGFGLESVIVGPDGKYLYATNIMGEIVKFTIGDDGALSNSTSISHPDGPVGMTFSPSGKYSYVVNLALNEISQFAVGVDGSLTPLTPATVAVTGCPSGPISSTTSKDKTEHVYVVSCSTDEVETFLIGADGTLSSQQTIKTGIMPVGMNITGDNLYVSNLGDSSLSMFSILADGTLQALPTPSVSAGIQPEGIAVDPIGGFAYALDFVADKIIPYTRDSSGELSKGTTELPSGSSPVQMLIHVQ